MIYGLCFTSIRYQFYKPVSLSSRKLSRHYYSLLWDEYRWCVGCLHFDWSGRVQCFLIYKEIQYMFKYHNQSRLYSNIPQILNELYRSVYYMKSISSVLVKVWLDSVLACRHECWTGGRSFFFMVLRCWISSFSTLSFTTEDEHLKTNLYRSEKSYSMGVWFHSW